MCFNAPRSRGPSASKSVSFPRRAFVPTSVNLSVFSITCIVSRSVTKSVIGSRSATQSATWSRILGLIPVFTLPTHYGTRSRPGLFLPIDRGKELTLVHLRAAADVQALRLVVELLLRLAAGTGVRAEPAPAARRHVAGRRP